MSTSYNSILLFALYINAKVKKTKCKRKRNIRKSFLKAGLYDEIFLSLVVKFFFSTVSFQHLTRVYSCEMWMKFFNLQSWKYFRRKNFYQIFDKNFSSEIHFTNQRSNLYWKWRKWLMWGEHERRNEWKFKNIRTTRKQKNQNNKTD